MKSRRDRILSVGGYILLGIIVVVGITFISGKLQWEWKKRHFICSHPDYLRLAKGMTMVDVEEILGKPTKVIQSDDETQNYYCVNFRGPNPDYTQDHMQCWYYQEFDGWLGDIHAYFDKDGILIGVGCGTG